MNVIGWTATELARFTKPVITNKTLLKQLDSHKRILDYVRDHPHCKEKDIISGARVSRITLLDLFDAGYLCREKKVGNGPLTYWIAKRKETA